MARKQSDTSRLAYDYIMANGRRDSHYKKIILALEWLVEGNNWQIAAQARMKPEQVWKRTGELCKPNEDGVSCLIDTGKRNVNPDGNMAIVYGLYENRANYKPPEPKHHPEIVPSDFASLLVAGTKQQKIIQQDLFNSVK